MSFRLFAVGAKTAIRALFLLSLAGLAIAENETQVVATIAGEITVNANGDVKEISLSNVKDAKLEIFLIKKVKSWAFYPMQINGKPVEATTGFHFDVIFTYDSDKSLKVVQFSDVQIEESVLETEINKKQGYKPSIRATFNYPINANNNGVEAKVIVAVDITADGKVKKADVTKLEIMNTASLRIAKVYSKEFVSKVLQGVKLWQWTPEELARNKCINGCIGLVSIDFVIYKNRLWRTYQLIPQDPIPWVIASELKDMDGSEKSQLVRLKDDPTGKPIDMGG